MDGIPLECDYCHKNMGLIILPDMYDGRTIKFILDDIPVTMKCDLCNKPKKKIDEDDKEEQQRQLESKYESIERHERASIKKE
jgi:hypothetical protein